MTAQTPTAAPFGGLFGPEDVIHTYSRAQAIADGELVAIPAPRAAEAGFKFPIAMTRAAYADTVAWDERTEARKGEGTGQSVEGRLSDVLWMAFNAVRDAKRRGFTGDRLPYALYRIPAEGRGVQARKTILVLHIGPGDTPAPVMTLMLEGED